MKFTRRELFDAGVAVGAASFLPVPLGGAEISAGSPRVAPSQITPWTERVGLIQQRLVHGGTPTFTTDFILADVRLDPGYPRRFSDFSGDLSGRYIGALALYPPDVEFLPRLGKLVRELITLQRTDGRFGNAALVFSADQIGAEHMALLWGNGRLLIGLLEYCGSQKQPDVLAAAARLGEFIVSVRQQCAQPAVQRRLANMGAFGYICFTQCLEGLAELSVQTGDGRYAAAAAEIGALLGERGHQHSHGYLTTLRGMLRLHEYDGDAKYLAGVESAYAALLRSNRYGTAATPDFTVFGGVPEFFGWTEHGNPSIPGGGARDEGCSEADFVRLSLQLWRLTHHPDYLERAEFCLLNQFAHNQRATGDFGHRTFSSAGFQPVDNLPRAWWCCDMHGLRALRDVRDAQCTSLAAGTGEGTGPGVRVHLYLDGTWAQGRHRVVMGPAPGDAPRFDLVWEQADGTPLALALRQPAWSEPLRVRVNGRLHATLVRDDAHWLERRWQTGDRVEVEFVYRTRLQLPDGTVHPLTSLGEVPTRAALLHGPYLLAVDEHASPDFFGEPWPENLLHYSGRLRPSSAAIAMHGLETLACPSARLEFDYVHQGFPGLWPVTLRPIGELTSQGQGSVAVWLNWQAARVEGVA